VLQRVATLIVQLAPPGSAVCRFGGEEFVLLLDDTRLSDAELLAHRLRLTVAALQWQQLGVQGQLTASFGVAQWSPGDHALADALGRADAALYRAKESGRNQVFLETHRSIPPSPPKALRSV
jgi:diguanylate cyclase (GGDEF)-like protein